MQRQIIHGIPYYVDSKNKLYTYSDDSVHIGSYNPTNSVVEYIEGIHATLGDSVKQWRIGQSSRSRKPEDKKDA
jgi:hypothetical protein